MHKALLTILIISSYCSAQDLKITKDGIAPVIVEVKDKTSADLFTGTKNWVNTYFKSPADVQIAEIQNEMLRIEGHCSDCWQLKTMGILYKGNYDFTIEAEFKDGKYKYSITTSDIQTNSSTYTYEYKNFFKVDGSIKKSHEKSVETLSASLNETFTSLKNYLTGVKKNDW